MFGLTMVVILKRKKKPHTHKKKKKNTHNQPYKIVMEMVIMERV